LFVVEVEVLIPTEEDQIRELEEGKELRFEEVELVDWDGESSKLGIMIKFRMKLLDNGTSLLQL